MTQTSTAESPWAVVTGASRGIGAAIARALAPRYRLILVARTQAPLQALAQELATETHILTADLADGPQTEALVDKILAHTSASSGALAALINNAGLAHAAPLTRTSNADYQRLVAVNLTAPFVLSRGLLKHLAAAEHARIVNIAS
ncbi:MAG: SDR family oxidoreductase, partial [Nannocystaceae bacterium]